jgi:outer membrane protein assembly factor BamB
VGTVINPGQALTESVTFSPTAPGVASGSYSITVNDGEGAHVVSLSGTGVSSGGATSVPSPTAGGWTLLGNAAVVSSASPAYLQLTNASSAGYEAGLAYYPTAVHGVGVTATFDALLENGTGADGLTFALLNAASGPPVLGVEGGGLGLGGNNGIAVALDTYQNGHNPSANFVGLTNDAISGGDVGTPVMDALQWVATSTNVPTLHNSSSPIHVVVTTTTTGVTVSVNGTQVLSWTGTVPTSAYLAFTGGDGGLTDLHAVENVTIAVNSASNPSPLSGPATMLSTYLSNNSRTGYDPTQTGLTTSNASSLKLDWTDTGGQGGFSQPTIVNGIAYWGDWNGNEHATNTTTGVDLWETTLGTTTPPSSDGCNPAEAGIVGTATVATVGSTTVVYVPGGNATMYALNAANGAILWQTNLGSSPDWFIWDSPVLANNDIYIGTASYGDCPLTRDNLVDLDADTGAILNTYATVPAGCVGGGMSASPAVDPADGSVYITMGTLQGGCAAGEPLAEAIVKFTSSLSLVSAWQIPADQQIGDSDFIATPTLFTATISGQARSLVGAANKNGTFYALNRSNLAGGPVWQQQIASTDGSCPQCSGAGGSIAPAAFDGTTLFVAGGATTVKGQSCGGSLNALNPATGAFEWQDCLGGSVLSAVVEVPGIVVTGYGTHLLVANASTGQSLFDYNSGGAFFYGAPTISNGMVLGVDDSGNLLAFGH